VNQIIPRSCDLVIRRATIIDGTGRARFEADVAVSGDRIAAVGDLGAVVGDREFDAAGHVLAPGFIDVHTHDDNALLVDPLMPAKVTQGVTTVVTGNCGVSLAPLVRVDPPPPLDLLGRDGVYRYARFADYVAAVEASPPAVNAAAMVGHSTLRVGAMRELDRPARDDEIAMMRAQVREALEAGAIGFSTGLFYPTNRAATADEVVALLQELAGTGAIYATHMRDEADGVEESLDESFETARRARVPLVISHHKCIGRRNFGRSRRTLERIDVAAQQQPVSLDVYPYTAGSTVLLPEMLELAESVRIAWSEPHPESIGRDLAEVAADWRVTPREALARLQPGGGIYFMMDEADVQQIMAYPHTMIGSDGLPHDAFPHPRLWGTFPRVLGRYARELRLLTLEQAVHRMTGLPAERFGLDGRGVIRPGAAADLVIFNPQTVIDRASFDAPTQPAAGIGLVVVNGATVLEEGRPTGARAGRVLRRPGSSGGAVQ
jgi:N-acyl-D-amino-acid deacylase